MSWEGKKYPLPHMVLMGADVEEYLPDVTDEELEIIANAMGEAFMYTWADVLSDVVTIIKGDRVSREKA